MRIQTRLLLLLLIVAVVPVAVSGGTAVLLSRKLVGENIEMLNVSQARSLAEYSESYISTAVGQLRLAAELLPFGDLVGEELKGALRIVYGMHDGYNLVALVDRRGTLRGTIHDESPVHHPVSPKDFEAFTQNPPPLGGELPQSAIVGPVYLAPDKGIPVRVLAAVVRGGDPAEPKILMVELSLDKLVERAQALAAQTRSSVYLVDGRGRVVAHNLPEVTVTRTDLSDRAPVQAITSGGLDSQGMVSYRAGTEPLAAAYARLGRWPGGVVVERPESEVYAPAREIAKQTAFWIVVALLCAIAAGTLLSRSISDPIRNLDRAAAALAHGDLEVRARVDGKDELGRLSSSFNEMADALVHRNEELRVLNEELQQRVEERTRELKQAQDQLLQSEKLAAVGELGAGVAHEINNPLAGVLGAAQLLLLRAETDSPSIEHLKNIEAEALRIREIVQNLLQLSQTRERGIGTLVDVNRVMEAALNLVARPIIAQRVRVTKTLRKELPKVRGDSSDLQQVFLHLLSNAKNAMPEGGELELSTGVIENRLVKVTVRDTGIGIPEEDMDKIFEPFFTRKGSWEGKGLGLSVVHRTVDQFGGRITVESEVGVGTTFTLVFPIVRDSLHLA